MLAIVEYSTKMLYFASPAMNPSTWYVISVSAFLLTATDMIMLPYFVLIVTSDGA